VLTLLTHYWRSVEIDLVVDNEKWIVVVDHIVVDTHTVQVLLEQVLEEEIFLLKSRLLFLNRELVEVNLVEAFVEVVQHFELVLSFSGHTLDFLHCQFGLSRAIRVRLVEG